MDEPYLAEHGHFARELEELQRLDAPVEPEPEPEPESIALAIMMLAAMGVVAGSSILISVTLRQQIELDTSLFNQFSAAVIFTMTVVAAACTPLILCQVAVEARRRADKAE